MLSSWVHCHQHTLPGVCTIPRTRILRIALFTLIELLAVITSGIYGILQARQCRMDMLGVFTLAFVTAFGGGTLRDLFLDRHPLFWIDQPHYPVIIFAMALVSFQIPRVPSKLMLYLNLPDAVGMALFTVAGAQFALDAGTSWFVAAMLGVTTGTFGGVFSDVLSNEVPRLFKASTPLFATCSFVGCWVYFGSKIVLSPYLPAGSPVPVIIAILFIVLFRMIAIRRNWTLPEAREKE